MLKKKHAADHSMYRRSARIGAWISLVASIGVMVTGDIACKIMTEVQPMKMAAAEALYETKTNAGFSIFTSARSTVPRDLHPDPRPALLPATGASDEVEGINQIRPQEQALAQGHRALRRRGSELAYDKTYTPVSPAPAGLPADDRPGHVEPVEPLTLWGTRKSASPAGGEAHRDLEPLLPVFAISFGWIFTEIGRQPWIVYGLMTTARRRLAVGLGDQRLDLDGRLTPCCMPRSPSSGQALHRLRQEGCRAVPKNPQVARRDVRRQPTAVRVLRKENFDPRSGSLLAVLWTGYLALEGFDFGVGMLLPILGRPRRRRHRSVAAS